MTPRNGGSGRRFWRTLVAIVLLALFAIGMIVLIPPAGQRVGLPSTLDEDDDREGHSPVPDLSPATDEDDESQHGFEQPPGGTSGPLPDQDDESAPATDTPGAAEGENDDERQ